MKKGLQLFETTSDITKSRIMLLLFHLKTSVSKKLIIWTCKIQISGQERVEKHDFLPKCLKTTKTSARALSHLKPDFNYLLNGEKEMSFWVKLAKKQKKGFCRVDRKLSTTIYFLKSLFKSCLSYGAKMSTPAQSTWDTLYITPFSKAYFFISYISRDEKLVALEMDFWRRSAIKSGKSEQSRMKE